MLPLHAMIDQDLLPQFLSLFPCLTCFRRQSFRKKLLLLPPFASSLYPSLLSFMVKSQYLLIAHIVPLPCFLLFHAAVAAVFHDPFCVIVCRGSYFMAAALHPTSCGVEVQKRQQQQILLIQFGLKGFCNPTSFLVSLRSLPVCVITCSSIPFSLSSL